nr:MAG TPA: putative integral membrane zinc-ribbon metal-binding protein [Caudoviricetes sp.]
MAQNIYLLICRNCGGFAPSTLFFGGVVDN